MITKNIPIGCLPLFHLDRPLIPLFLKPSLCSIPIITSHHITGKGNKIRIFMSKDSVQSKMSQQSITHIVIVVRVSNLAFIIRDIGKYLDDGKLTI